MSTSATIDIPRLPQASSPDAYRFIGSYDNKRSRIGNSVPPLLMRAIASHIRTHILERATDA
jgi:site-specific DNA-cytosine methylase